MSTTRVLQTAAERRPARASKPLPKTTFTPPEVASRWRVKVDKVHALIRAGRLGAFDVAAPGSRRPRWRIPIEAVLAFEAGRASPAPTAPRKKRPAAGAVIEFFK